MRPKSSTEHLSAFVNASNRLKANVGTSLPISQLLIVCDLTPIARARSICFSPALSRSLAIGDFDLFILVKVEVLLGKALTNHYRLAYSDYRQKRAPRSPKSKRPLEANLTPNHTMPTQPAQPTTCAQCKFFSLSNSELDLTRGVCVLPKTTKTRAPVSFRLRRPQAASTDAACDQGSFDCPF